MERDFYDLIILGGGCAGLTAGIYAGRSGLRTLILENGMPGGQIVNTGSVENYPGFERIHGAELAGRMQQQAQSFGARLHCCGVRGVELSREEKCIETDDGILRARAVIAATGAAPRTLDIPGEAEFRGRGVSYCATCDGFFYRGRDIVVVGGGNSAAHEALELAQYGSTVTMLVRKDRLRCEEYLRQKLEAQSNIRIRYCAVAEALSGQERLESVTIRDTRTGQLSRIDGAPGFFVSIGHAPATRIFRGQLDMDEAGYLLTDGQMHTNIPGVYAAGDVRAKQVRQLVTAAADGAIAAMQAQQELAQ